MIKKELEFYWMSKQVQLRLLNNEAIVNSYAPFEEDAIKFNTDIAALELIMPSKLVIGSGYTLDLEVEKKNCSAYWDVSVCKIIKGFALKYGNNTLFEQVNFTQSKFTKTTVKGYYSLIANLNDVCEKVLLDANYIAGNYAVTADVLDTGMALANTFLSVSGQAKQVRTTKGQTGVKIRKLLKMMQTNLTVMDNDVYGVVNTTFRGQYLKDRKFGNNVLHTIINVLVTDKVTGIPIKRVFAINVGANRGDYTDIDGKVALHKKGGTNIITFSHKDVVTKLPDYEPQTVRVTAIYKKTVKLVVELAPVVAKKIKEAVPEEKKVE